MCVCVCVCVCVCHARHGSPCSSPGLVYSQFTER